MGASESPFKPLPFGDGPQDLQALISRPRSAVSLPVPTGAAPTTARLYGFDLQDAPVLSGFAQWPGELVTARTTVALRQAMIGSRVLVLHEDGDWRRPIVVGVLQDAGSDLVVAPGTVTPTAVQVRSDDERLTLTAEREIVLRCGDASITLTRAGKVIIKGNYVLSRSTGYNKIKGAAIDIN
ncbi:DUF6484 domain-containing protein [soil metagenome]